MSSFLLTVKAKLENLLSDNDRSTESDQHPSYSDLLIGTFIFFVSATIHQKSTAAALAKIGFELRWYIPMYILDVIIFFYRCDQIISHKSNSYVDIHLAHIEFPVRLPESLTDHRIAIVF